MYIDAEKPLREYLLKFFLFKRNSVEISMASQLWQYSIPNFNFKFNKIQGKCNEIKVQFNFDYMQSISYIQESVSKSFSHHFQLTKWGNFFKNLPIYWVSARDTFHKC